MAIIERFLGQRLEIPDGLLYQAGQGFWARRDGHSIVFGLTEPALALLGGLSEVQWLTPDGRRVAQGEAVVFAITGKILYLDAPSAGTIWFNHDVKQDPSLAAQDPYGKGWLFRIRPGTETADVLQEFMGAVDYVKTLGSSEGIKNREGLKSRKTGMCNAVYKGIRQGVNGSCC
jgi:glycine cleavage system H protein